MFKKLLVALAGFVSLVYIINPTAGLIELIPDAFPIVGNLDEAAAVTLLLAALRYFGVDMTSWFNRGGRGGGGAGGPSTIIMEENEYGTYESERYEDERENMRDAGSSSEDSASDSHDSGSDDDDSRSSDD